MTAPITPLSLAELRSNLEGLIDAYLADAARSRSAGFADVHIAVEIRSAKPETIRAVRELPGSELDVYGGISDYDGDDFKRWVTVRVGRYWKGDRVGFQISGDHVRWKHGPPPVHDTHCYFFDGGDACTCSASAPTAQEG